MNNFKNIRPFVWFSMQNFPFIEETYEEMNYYKLMCRVVEKLNEVIRKANETGEQVQDLTQLFEQLKEYIEHYFDNLDVQEEINNKLDEMAESGELTEIIAQYLTLNGILTFNTVNDMINSENIVEGSICKTMGFYELNDGGSALYKIRKVTNQDDTSYNAIIPIETDESLVAEIINKNIYNLKCYGVSEDTEDCSVIVQKLIDNIESGSTIIFPNETLTFKDSIDLSNNPKIYFRGCRDNTYNQNGDSKIVFDDCSGFINCLKTNFRDIDVVGTNYGNGFTGVGMRIFNCQISNFDIGIKANYNSIVVNKCEINRNRIGIENPVDSRIINNTINANTYNGISIGQGANDNIISNNKIEWNENNGVSVYKGVHNLIANNIIDRNSLHGVVLNDTSRCVLADNIFRRNGVTQVDSTDYSQIRLEKAVNCTIVGNMTETGNSNDDGTGYDIPQYALITNTCEDIFLIGNDFTGGLKTNPVVDYNNTNVKYLDVNHNVEDLLRKLNSSKSITANGTNTFDIDLDLPVQNQLPKYKKLVISWRSQDEAVYGVKEVYAFSYVQYTNIRCGLTDDTLYTDVEISIAYADDKFAITCTNNSAKNINVKIDEYSI